MSLPSGDRLEELLAAALEAFDRGGDEAMAAFVAQHPEEQAALRRGIARCREMGMLGGGGPARDFPDRLGEFRLLRRLGGGGMGVVFEAEQTSLSRRVALKVIRPELLYFEGARERFRREIQAVARLSHPAVVPVLASGEQDGVPFYVMELLAGRTAQDIVAGLAGRDPAQLDGSCLREVLDAADAEATDPFHGTWWQVCARLVHAVALGVRHAHVRGIVHRDIKPSNVMITPHGQAVLLDFGVASVAGSREFTRSGSTPGSPAFMSPEQLRGDAVDERTDVYSLGATLWHLLALAQPFRGVDDLQRIVAGDLPSLRAKNREVPRELELVVRTATDRDRERRYSDMEAFANDLQAVLRRRPIRARRLGLGLRAWRWSQRHRAAATLLGTLVLVGAALPGLLAWRERAANRELAAANATIQRRADDVLSLSAIQELKELEDRADTLWPADPVRLPELEAWLADARLLVEGQPADPASGRKQRPSLAQHEQKLAEIRQRAKPRTRDQVEADRRAAPAFSDWQRAGAELEWMRRMLGSAPWPAEEEVAAALAKAHLPPDATGLNAEAWRLVDVDPVKVVFGQEVRGLALARRALAAASAAERGVIRDTVAWALYRCGRLDEALAEAERAVAEAVADDRGEIRASQQRLLQCVERWRPGPGRAELAAAAAQLDARVAELRRAIDAPQTWDFADSEDRWWHAQLAKLVSDLQAFTNEQNGGLFSAGVSAQHGWGMVRRARFAATLRERSVAGPEAQRRWSAALAALAADARFAGAHVEPQVGLLPLGADPESGLQEFAHLATGEPPVRGADGRLVLTEAMGLVFVLLPGGAFVMGAQKADPARPNFDAGARSDESPVHEVRLAPFLLSKFEMTQGQWERFQGSNPSGYGPGRYAAMWNRERRGWSALHPVEQVTWPQCSELVARLGLLLPSEAQWEYAARAGTDTPWWTGPEVESLAAAANVLDAYATTHGGESWTGAETTLDDGNSVHAEVGSYQANAFGLCDMIGNVWEWCADGYDSYFYARCGENDPVAPWSPGDNHVDRGGGFGQDASHGRAAFRNDHTPTFQDSGLGLRPAMALRVGAAVPAGAPTAK
ncbi:MAG: bifunctional serine/threonine-protein kinase/formylglycine-generating enzyme family protein [Planctomycetota bacterium]